MFDELLNITIATIFEYLKSVLFDSSNDFFFSVFITSLILYCDFAIYIALCVWFQGSFQEKK